MTAAATPAEFGRQLVRAAMAATEATSGAYFEHTAGGTLRGVMAEGLFPPLRAPSPAESASLITRAGLLEWVFRLPEISLADGLFAKVVSESQGELIAHALADSRVVPMSDPALTLRSLIAVPVTANGRCSGVLAVANPVTGGAFSEQDFAAVQVLVAQTLSGA